MAGGHKWFQHPKFRPLVTCKLCGIVQRADGRNKPCPGPTRVQLRDNRVVQTAAPAPKTEGE